MQLKEFYGETAEEPFIGPGLPGTIATGQAVLNGLRIRVPRILRPLLQVFAENSIAAALKRGADDEAIPPRKRVMLAKIECSIEKLTA